jgi:Coenzyme PQQ synthesis protein D (PqqD)
MSAAKPVRPHDEVVARRMGEAVVLIHLGTNRIYELNATGARIWELLAEGRSVEEIEEALSTEFEAGSVDVAAEVERLIELVRTEKLVDVDHGA